MRSGSITTLLGLMIALPLASLTWSGETRFTSGPQEYAGTKYYWLAEWKLEITVPSDVGPDDRFEMLFGSKGPHQRTLHFEHGTHSGSFADHCPTPFEWVALPLPTLEAGKKITLSGKGHDRVAFLAGIRITGSSSANINVKRIRVAGSPYDAEYSAVWADVPPVTLDGESRRLWLPTPDQPNWSRAERSARIAGIALTKVQRWLHEECLPIRDKKSGLFRATGPVWTYWDTAADCYPFYVWAAYFTDKNILDSVMVETLAAEQRLCNRVGALPVAYNMDTGEQLDTSPDRIVFGASEYVKDGLVPIVELTGSNSPWFARMRAIVDELFHQASIDTPYGQIPSTNIEVNGELLQVLPRLYRMTGEHKYLDWAHRLADFYLLKGDFVPTRLSDHGCEIIGGLGLLFAVDTCACPEKSKQYQPHLEFMFDEILKRGVNSDGIIIGEIQPTKGPHDNAQIRDGWGYDFVGFLDYDLALRTQRYQAAIRKPLTRLLGKRYQRFNWDHGSRDNIADSVEGGLYLLRRFPVAEGFLWADREIASVLVDHTDPDRLWGVHKLEANTVRTVLIHTMLHTRNTIARPWQPGLELGAAPCREGICLVVKSNAPYDGVIQFDIPRHREFIGFKQDWPRMNSVPEWFVVEPDAAHSYTVEDVTTSETKTVTGKSLHEGFAVSIPRNGVKRLIIQPTRQ